MKKLTKKELSWITYDWANSAYSLAITTAIFPVFFKNVAAKGVDASTSTAFFGYTNSVASFLIAILAPILGAMADYKGRKKKFFTTFLLIGILGTGLLSIVGEGQVVLCSLIYTLSVVGYSGTNIFYDAFLIDVTKDENMDKVSSLGFGFGYIGSCIPFIISIILISKPALIGLTTIEATRIAFIITALWWLIFSLPILKNVNQEYYIEPVPNVIKTSFVRLKNTFLSITKYKNVFMFLLAYFFYIDGVNTIIKMSTAFGMDLGLNANKLMIILLVLQVVAFPCAIIYGKLADRFSARAMILVGIITYIGITIYGYFLKTEFDYWVIAILVGSAQGGIQALSRSYFGKLIPKESNSEFFGIYNIVGRFSAVFGPLLMGVFTQITGNSKFGVLSILILFIIGLYFFSKVRDGERLEVSKNKSV